MKTIDAAVVRQWMDFDLEGELSRSDKTFLEEALEARPELRAERRQLESLHGMLAQSRVAVRAGFRSAVCSALPVASWERGLSRRRVPAWVLPAAMVLVFALGAGLVLSLGGASGPEAQALGFVGVVWDFLATTTLAGAGLLFATWRGVGLGLEQLIADSGLNLLALAAAVFFLDLLFVALLRRRPAMVRLPAEDASRDKR